MVKVPDNIINTAKKLKSILGINSSIDFQKMILFGSYARGNYSNNSDIDLCIIVNNISNNYNTLLKIAPDAAKVDTRIEPVVFSSKEFSDNKPAGLLKEIKKYGIEI